jgi:putative heme-binding domain-containing protein
MRHIPEIDGGDWHRGKQVFSSSPANCSTCHQARGEGGSIGPDLSNLIHRDYASVIKDITQPSAAINPDRINYVVELKDGTSVDGVLVEDTPQELVLGQLAGGNRVISRNNVRTLKASAVSLMPEGLLQSLNLQQQRDLMTYLLTEPSSGNTK